MKILLLILVAFIGSFELLPASPDPTTSRFFYSEGGGFVVGEKDNERIVKYAVTLKVLEEIPKGSLLFFRFENPLEKTRPIETKIEYDGENQITVKSEAVWGLEPNGVYTYFVSVRTSDEAESQIGSHRQDLLFGMSEDQFEALMMPWYGEKTERNREKLATSSNPTD